MLKEKASLARKLAEKYESQGDFTGRFNLIRHAEEAEAAIKKLNQLLYSSSRRRKEESHELEE